MHNNYAYQSLDDKTVSLYMHEKCGYTVDNATVKGEDFHDFQ